ncbi:pro-epidermal growth factor isoform X2 [Protopterus annectens]|uniref:pro-epidermal growth factor isoform X2 n=1 Tax=Protopterus annectens TaxID=7888 RepID=UPI001CFAC0D7|nr:pro-epidermal growth factor isoform X2 [Protopterus annectens]
MNNIWLGTSVRRIMPLLLTALFLLVSCRNDLPSSASLQEWSCLEGYRVASDNTSCIDIDECAEGRLGVCGQICTNVPGSYICSCHPGYTLDSNKWSCYADDPSPYIIFSQGKAIYRIDTEGTNYKQLVADVGMSLLLDFHYKQDKLYWVDTEKGYIQTMHTIGTEIEIIHNVGQGVSGFAVNWVHSTIIWTKTQRGTIETADLDGRNKEVLMQNLIYPTVITIDPTERFIFWASNGSISRIFRASLQGANLTTILRSSQKVKSLSLDLIDKRIFWIQHNIEDISSIGSCDYSGGFFQLMKQSTQHQSLGMSLFAEHIYYTDQKMCAIKRANKYTGKDLVTISPQICLLPPIEIKVVHPFMQPNVETVFENTEQKMCLSLREKCARDCSTLVKVDGCDCEDGFVLSKDSRYCEDINECAFWNHGCTLGCVNIPGSYFCYCPKGFVLLPDMKTCHELVPCLENGTDCSYGCTETAKGPKCFCPDGSVLHSEGKTCTGCTSADNGGCSQVCEPLTPQSWKCDCLPGYRLQPDGKHCSASGPRPFLLFANIQDIRRINFDGTDYQSILDKQMGRVLALDYDPVENKVYFAHTGLKWIERANLDGSERERIIEEDIDLSEGLAMDWISRKLYWTDTGQSRIERSDLSGGNREVIIKDSISKPRGIAVHPVARRLFWTDCGEKPNIGSSSLEGLEKVVIVSTNLQWPSGITIDYLADRLYWCDTLLSVIETSALDGTSRRVLTQNEVGRPFDVAVFEDHVWFTDWSKPSLMRIDKWNGQNRVRLRGNMTRPASVAIVHPLAKPGADPCIYQNGGCGQICENRIGISHCLCHDGFVMDSDSKTCHALERPETTTVLATSNAGPYVNEEMFQNILTTSPSTGSSTTNAEQQQQQPIRSTLIAEIMVSDQDNCTALQCDINAQCVPKADGAACQCLEGFMEDDKSCSDIDECTTHVDLCDRKMADCINTEGSYVCKCLKGYTGDGLHCYESPVPTNSTNRSTSYPTRHTYIGSCPPSHESFCLHEGVCFQIAELETYACRCVNGYMGDRCQYHDLKWWELQRIEEVKRRNIIIAVSITAVMFLLTLGACVTYCYRNYSNNNT